jgi:hypothetical protein
MAESHRKKNLSPPREESREREIEKEGEQEGKEEESPCGASEQI